MRNAYVLLGLSFIIVFGGAYILFKQAAHAPTTNDLIITNNQMSLSLTSPVFNEGEMIPQKYTCDGDNVNPPLVIANIPEGTQSLVLVMDDPDIPSEIKEKMGIEKFNHWSVYNLPATTIEISEASEIGSTGLNTPSKEAYTGPCPPTEYEPTTHRYVFRLYALSGQLNFIKTPTLDEIETASQGIMLEKAELTGLYSRVTD